MPAAGVIKIITKNSSPYKYSTGISIQGESAGEEVGFHQGRQLAHIFITGNLTKNLFARINAGKNQFFGYNGDATGREKEWNPKDQTFANGQFKYTFEKFSIRYKLDYLHELIEDQGRIIDNIQPSTGVNHPYSFDEEFLSKRWINLVELDGKSENRLHYNLVFSFSDYQRNKNRYSVDLNSGNGKLTSSDGDQDTSQFKAVVLQGFVLQNFNPKISIQLGYDINLESALGGRIVSGVQQINDIAFYSTGEWLPNNKWKIRPGLRYAYNSKYNTPLLPSINVKYDLNNSVFFRAAYGKGYRAPTLRELYFEFVDSNHSIYGNKNLKPEDSHHFDISLDWNKKIKYASINTSLGFFYNNINNQIALAQSPVDNTITTYFNLLKYKTIGFTIEQAYAFKSFEFKIGFSYTGRYNQFSENDSIELLPFFYSPQVNSQVTWSPNQFGGILAQKAKNLQQNTLPKDLKK